MKKLLVLVIALSLISGVAFAGDWVGSHRVV